MNTEIEGVRAEGESTGMGTTAFWCSGEEREGLAGRQKGGGKLWVCAHGFWWRVAAKYSAKGTAMKVGCSVVGCMVFQRVVARRNV